MWFLIPVPIPRIQKAIPAHLCADFDDDNDGDEDEEGDDDNDDVGRTIYQNNFSMLCAVCCGCRLTLCNFLGKTAFNSSNCTNFCNIDNWCYF